MNYIKNIIKNIQKDCELLSIKYQLLTNKELLICLDNSQLKQTLKLNKLKRSGIPLWHFMDDCNSHQDPDGWQVVSNVLKSKKNIIWFFEALDIAQGILLEDPSNIYSVLRERSTSLDYFTNVEGDFIICLNDHDFVIWCGEECNVLDEHYFK